MNPKVRLGFILIVGLLGTLFLLAFGRMIAWYVVSLTGQGWLFGVLPWILIGLFWFVLYRLVKR